MNPIGFLKKWRDQVLGLSMVLGGVVLLLDGKTVEGWTAISGGLAFLFSGSYT